MGALGHDAMSCLVEDCIIGSLLSDRLGNPGPQNVCRTFTNSGHAQAMVGICRHRACKHTMIVCGLSSTSKPTRTHGAHNLDGQGWTTDRLGTNIKKRTLALLIADKMSDEKLTFAEIKESSFWKSLATRILPMHPMQDVPRVRTVLHGFEVLGVQTLQ